MEMEATDEASGSCKTIEVKETANTFQLFPFYYSFLFIFWLFVKNPLHSTWFDDTLQECVYT